MDMDHDAAIGQRRSLTAQAQGTEQVSGGGDAVAQVDEYVGEVVLAARHYDDTVLSVNGFRADLLRVAQALEMVIRLHRPLGSGRHPLCLSCRSEYPCHTRTEITRQLTQTRLLPDPHVPDGERPALFGPGRAAITAGREA